MSDNDQSLFNSIDEERRYLINAVDRSFYEDYSADDSWSFFREQGFSIGREEFRDLRRNILGRAFHTNDIARLSDEDYIPNQWMYDRHGMQLSSKYLYRYTVYSEDVDTGEIEQFERYFATSQEMSIGQVKDRVQELSEMRSGSLPLEISDIIIRGVYLSTNIPI